MMRTTLILLVLLSGVVIAPPMPATEPACVEMTTGMGSMHHEAIRLLNDEHRELSINVLVADSVAERSSGFQHICPQIIQRTLILFRFAHPVRSGFHMHNVFAPLDIAFFDSFGYVVGVRLMEIYTEDSQPIYDPGGFFQYALEAPAGFFRQWKISTQGSRLILP